MRWLRVLADTRDATAVRVLSSTAREYSTTCGEYAGTNIHIAGYVRATELPERPSLDSKWPSLAELVLDANSVLQQAAILEVNQTVSWRFR